MTTRILFAGEVHVHYGQIYVESEHNSIADLADNFVGQTNGLCGAAMPGALFLMTGLHTGTIDGFTVELHDSEPPVGTAWEEVVDVSFRPASPKVSLVQWAGEASWSLDLEAIDYRVRYSASGMDAAQAADVRMPDEPAIDRYLLQFWPAPPAADRVLKQTGEIAAYWHNFARDLPSAAEQAERKRQQRLAKERAREEERALLRQQVETRDWGGRLPTDRLREVGGNARALAAIDRDLVDAIAAADPDLQRAVALTAVHLAYAGAGLTGVHWIAAALAALDLGDDLPAPFDGDVNGVWNRVVADSDVPRTIIPGTDNYSRQAFALSAIFQAAQADPLRAALDAVHTAMYSYGTDRGEVLDEIRALLQ